MFKNRKQLPIITFLLLVSIFVAIGAYFLVKNQGAKDNKTPLNTIPETTSVAGCTRATRLDNKPVYDRALSLIQEKYSTWEQGGKGNYGTWYFFPSQLVNCIKVVDGNVRNATEAEGYFVFNDTAIKDNYFPITVGKDYSDADDLVNALLLVHEMTHVRQYLDSLNNEDQLSCIDKEVEAFDAAYNFYRWQFGENEKSLNLRIQYDNDLHPQLQILKNINQLFSGVIQPLTGENGLCEGAGAKGDECGDRIADNRRKKIKDVISQDELYIKQCKL